eukprot:Opistho-1_new@28465
MKNIFNFILVMFLTISTSFAQNLIKGKIFDSSTKEPVVGASVKALGTTAGTTTNINGEFALKTKEKINKISISSIGFQTLEMDYKAEQVLNIPLEPSVENLQQVVVTANREAGLRTEAPIAISKLSSTLINDAKPTSMYEIINKTPMYALYYFNTRKLSG